MTALHKTFGCVSNSLYYRVEESSDFSMSYVAAMAATLSSQHEAPKLSIIGMSGLIESKLGGESLATDVAALSSGS